MVKLATLYFILAGFTLATVHFLATELFLYWRFPHLDIGTHLIGGAALGLLPFMLREIRVLDRARTFSLWSVLLFVIAVAAAWEVLDTFIDHPFERDALGDTLLDLAVGLMGGAIGYFVGRSGTMEGV